MSSHARKLLFAVQFLSWERAALPCWQRASVVSDRAVNGSFMRFINRSPNPNSVPSEVLFRAL